jgi:AraC family transcriptional regulator
VSVAGSEAITWLRVREASDVVQVIASPNLRRSLAEELGVPGVSDLDDLHGGTDSVVWAIGVRLRAGVRNLVEVSVLERDFLVRHLYRRIFATRFGGRLAAKGDGGLDPRRLSRVTEFIEAHLISDLTVEALADVAALSKFHFLRSFKRSTGVAPHRYVLGRRLEGVRHAIETGIDATRAARNAGFSHMRHFREVYRRHHGFAPEQTPRGGH